MKPLENNQSIASFVTSLAAVCIVAGSSAWSFCSVRAAYAENRDADVLPTSICELVSRPELYNKKIVVVAAEFHASMDAAVLIDANCPSAGVVPVSKIDKAHDPLSAALSHGCLGTKDKIISAIWIGEYRFKKNSELRPGEFPRLLNLKKIENFSARRIPGASDCGRP